MRIIVVVSPATMAEVTYKENELLQKLRRTYGKPALVAGPRNKNGPMLLGLTVQQEDHEGITFLGIPELDEPRVTAVDRAFDFIIENQINIYGRRDAWIFAESRVIQIIRRRAQNAPIGVPPPFFILRVDQQRRITEIDSLPN